MSVDSIYHPHSCVRCRARINYYHTHHLGARGVSYRLGDQPHAKDLRIHAGSVSVISPCRSCKTTTLARAVIREGRLCALFEHHGTNSRLVGQWPSTRGKFFSFLPFREAVLGSES